MLLDRGLRDDELPGGGKLRRFVVPGIPGGAHIAGNVFWVQGRCMMVLGNETSGPFDGRWRPARTRSAGAPRASPADAIPTHPRGAGGR